MVSSLIVTVLFLIANPVSVINDAMSLIISIELHEWLFEIDIKQKYKSCQNIEIFQTLTLNPIFSDWGIDFRASLGNC